MVQALVRWFDELLEAVHIVVWLVVCLLCVGVVIGVHFHALDTYREYLPGWTLGLLSLLALAVAGWQRGVRRSFARLESDLAMNSGLCHPLRDLGMRRAWPRTEDIVGDARQARSQARTKLTLLAHVARQVVADDFAILLDLLTRPGFRLCLILIDPDGPAVRAMEDRQPIHDRGTLAAGAWQTVNTLRKQLASTAKEKRPRVKGALEVWFAQDDVPYRIESFDDERLYWTPYILPTQVGMCPSYEVREGHLRGLLLGHLEQTKARSTLIYRHDHTGDSFVHGRLEEHDAQAERP